MAVESFLTEIDIKKLVILLKSGSKVFLMLVAKKWQDIGHFETGRIIKDEFSGRPGLRRISGNAARSLMSNTEIKNGSVYTHWFTDPRIAKYVPIHQYGGTITPKNGKALVFKVPISLVSTAKKSGRITVKKSYQLVFAKKVVIPKRLHIIERFSNPGTELRAKGVLEAMKEITEI